MWIQLNPGSCVEVDVAVQMIYSNCRLSDGSEDIMKC